MTAKGSNNDDGFKKEMLEKIAARIRSLRKKRGYDNYEKFAYEHNLNRSQYGRYEKGEDLRFTSLVRVCRAFGVTLSEFFSEGFDD
jgi:transcriptional regulator with XRE-family HTH domain